jgi:hypothetical protein
MPAYSEGSFRKNIVGKNNGRNHTGQSGTDRFFKKQQITNVVYHRQQVVFAGQVGT